MYLRPKGKNTLSAVTGLNPVHNRSKVIWTDFQVHNRSKAWGSGQAQQESRILSAISAKLFSVYTPGSLGMCISHLYVSTHHLCTQLTGFSYHRLGVDGTSGVERGMPCCLSNHCVAFLLDTDGKRHLCIKTHPWFLLFPNKTFSALWILQLRVLLRDEDTLSSSRSQPTLKTDTKLLL